MKSRPAGMTRRTLLACMPAWALALLPRAARGEVPPVYSIAPAGHAPGNFGLAIAPDGAAAYVSFSSEDTLLEVDLKSWTVRGAIDTGPAGSMLTSKSARLSADGRWLMVANTGTSNVMVADTVARRLVAVLPIKPELGDSICLAPDGGSFLIAGSDGYLYRVSIPDWSYRTLARPAGGPFVRSIAISAFAPDILYWIGERPSTKDRALAVYRLSDQTVRATLPIPADISPTGWTPTLRACANSPTLLLGVYQYTGTRGLGSICQIDASQPAIVATAPIDCGVTDLVVCEDLGKAYTIGFWSGGNSPQVLPLTEWDIASAAVTRVTPMDQATDLRAIVRHPTDPNSVFITEGDRDHFRRFSLDTGARAANLAFNTSQAIPRSLIQAGGRAIAVCRGDRTLRHFDWQTLSFGPPVPNPNAFNGGAYHAGVIYFLGGNQAYALNAETGATLRTYKLSTQLTTSCPSVTGNHLVCIDYSGGMVGRRMLVFSLADFSLVREFPLNGVTPCADKVAISPDGSRAYLCGGLTSGPLHVIVFDTATWEVRRTLDIAAGASGFAEADFDEARRVCYLTGFNSVHRIHMDTDELLSNHDVKAVLAAMGRTGGWSPNGLAGCILSADASRLYVASGDVHTVYTFDCERLQWLPHILNLHDYFVTDAAASPDRRYFLTVNGLSDSFSLVDTTIGQVVALFDLHAASQPSLLPFNLVNAASQLSGPVAPGEVVTIYGLRIGPDDPAYGQPDGDGYRVLFDGEAAQLIFAANNQINAVVPGPVAGKDSVPVWLETPRGPTNAIAAAIAPTSPGLFTADGSGIGQATAENADGSLNGSDRPASRGSVVTLWATGLGVDTAVTAEIDSRAATVVSVAAAGGSLPGVSKIAVRVPSNATVGVKTATIIAGAARSLAGVTVVVS